MKKKGLWTLLAVLVIALAGGSVLYKKLSGITENANLSTETMEEQTDENNNVKKNTAADFTVLNAQGEEVSLSDYFGKPIVLNFWASWCTACGAMLPNFESQYEQYGDQVEFVMVNLTDGSRETLESAKAYVEEKGYTFPVYFDTESEAALTYSVRSIPATFFINKNGNLIARTVGQLNDEKFQNAMNMVLPKNEA